MNIDRLLPPPTADSNPTTAADTACTENSTHLGAVDSRVVLNELDEVFATMALFSEEDEQFTEHASYGLLALLWGRVPLLDNVAYRTPGMPTWLSDDPELDDIDRAQWRIEDQAPALAKCWSEVSSIVFRRGHAVVLAALIEAETTWNFDDRPAFCGAIAHRWEDVAKHYGGKQPFGLSCPTPMYFWQHAGSASPQ